MYSFGILGSCRAKRDLRPMSFTMESGVPSFVTMQCLMASYSFFGRVADAVAGAGADADADADADDDIDDAGGSLAGASAEGDAGAFRFVPAFNAATVSELSISMLPAE